MAMSPKNPAAVSLGRKGGKARVENQTPEERIESARRAAKARWAKTKELVEEITEGTKALLDKAKKSEAVASKKKKVKA